MVDQPPSFGLRCLFDFFNMASWNCIFTIQRQVFSHLHHARFCATGTKSLPKTKALHVAVVGKSLTHGFDLDRNNITITTLLQFSDRTGARVYYTNGASVHWLLFVESMFCGFKRLAITVHVQRRNANVKHWYLGRCVGHW